MLVVGHGFESLDFPIIRIDNLPHLPTMEHGGVLGGFFVSTFPRKKKKSLCIYSTH